MSVLPLSRPAAGAQGALEVFSCGTRPDDEILRACRAMDHVFGSARLLDPLREAGVALHGLSPAPRQALDEAMDLAARGARVAVLGSGDALYHGIGGTLVSRLNERFPDPERTPIPFRLAFHPGITAFQGLCHRLGLDWSEAELFSVHHGAGPLRRMLQAKTALVYAGLPLTGSLLAEALCAVDPASGQRRCLVAEKLDTPEERVLALSLAEAAQCGAGPTTVLALLPEGRHGLPLPLGLADEAFRFENHCLTARRLRPLVLSCLCLPPRGVLWDLGAGSGSVSLEAALLQPGLEVHAVEQFPERCGNIRGNARRLGVCDYRVHEGRILDILPGLPDPDRVFVGGGGKDLPEILRRSLARLNVSDPEACCVVTAITMESVAQLSLFDGGDCVEALSIDLAFRRGITAETGLLEPLHRIHVFVFRPRA